MTEATLHNKRIRAGVWEGLLTGQTDMPRLEVMHLETALSGLSVTKVVDVPDQWSVQVPIPAQAISDGVQTFIIRDISTGTKLAHFSVIAGDTISDDIRAEIDLLRAELDLLKRAFRRHCVETAS